jgi:hypothetical protein
VDSRRLERAERRASTGDNMASRACHFFQEIGGVIRIPE